MISSAESGGRVLRSAGRIADGGREIADQENHPVAQILEVFHLAQQHSVPEVQIRSGGIKAHLHCQRDSAAQ